MEVDFYSVPEQGEITWFYKDVIVGTNVTSQSVIAKTINITLYEKKVPVNGYSAKINAKQDTFPLTELLNCQVQNIYGVLDISFADITFSNSTMFDGVYIRTGTLDRNIVSKKKVERGKRTKNSVKGKIKVTIRMSIERITLKSIRLLRYVSLKKFYIHNVIVTGSGYFVTD